MNKRKAQPASRRPRRAKSGPVPTAPWPSAADSDKRRQALAAAVFRKYGITPEREPTSGIFASRVLDVLGRASLAGFRAVRSPGRVIWCNFDLARQLGFDVPRTNQLTPPFHDRLLAALSFRSVGAKDHVDDRDIVTLYADRYGGDGVTPGLGAGRAGFLPYGNLYVKGVGFTPLFRRGDPDDFVHSHGGVHLEDCLSEAVFGEVNENLFTLGSTRVLAIVDQHKHVTDPSGRQRPIALVVRAGAQLRPGHLLGRQGVPGRSLLNKFLRIVRATQQLVTRTDKATGVEIPDLASTLRRIIDDHARTAADGFRWRMIHGAISASNMEMNGAMLDLPTQSSQPRTAPVWTLDWADSVFGVEHRQRADRLVPMYRKLVRSMTPRARRRFNAKSVNLFGEMETAYRRHLALKLIGATGLKTETAGRIQIEHPELAGRFADLILKMSRLKNRGSVSVSNGVVERVSVLDVFRLLGSFPAVYFEHPRADHTGAILRALSPVYRGTRSRVARKRMAVKALVSEFAGVYRELMDAAATYAAEYHGDLKRMHASTIARARFENAPLVGLYYRRLYEDLKRAMVRYRSTGDAEIVREAIDRRIAASLRSVDALVVQGSSRRLDGGGIELEMRTINGINYSVRAGSHDTRRLHVCVPAVRKGKYYLSAIPGFSCLTKAQIQALRYRFSTDAWRSSGEVRARLRHHRQDGLIIDFDALDTVAPVGRLEGYCRLGGASRPADEGRRECFGGYAFAMPDARELRELRRAPPLTAGG